MPGKIIFSIRNNFKSRLFLSYVTLSLVTLIPTFIFLSSKLESKSLEEITRVLAVRARLIGAQVDPLRFKEADRDYLKKFADEKSLIIGSRITVIDKTGIVLADSEVPGSQVGGLDNHSNRPEIKDALRQGIGKTIRRSNTLDKEMLYMAVPVYFEGEALGALRISLYLGSIKATMKTVRNTLLYAFIIAFLFSGILTLLFVRGIAGPLAKIIRVSKSFSRGDFKDRIIHSSQDELGELSATLNKMAKDIEERMEEVKDKTRQLQAIFDSMTEGVIVTDNLGRVTSVNLSIERIFNISERDVRGRLLIEVIPNSDLDAVINEAIGSGGFVSREINLSWPIQAAFQVNASAVKEKDSVRGCLAVIHDVTELRKLETIRRDFVANVSHELKTPLTSIKGFVETLLEGAMEDRENNREFLMIIKNHAQRLENLVDDLLSLSSLESRQSALNRQEFSPYLLADEVIPTFNSRLRKAGIAIENKLSRELVVAADKERIRQVFINLIDNAIKFNKEGGKVILAEESAGNSVKFFVRDTGIGIPDKDIPRIFERFYRVDKARSRQLGGTGLGLSIVRHIIELHGGIVGVDSEETIGSEFWFTLPA